MCLDVPCKDCTERQPSCHSQCPRYLEFQEQSRKLRLKRAAAQESNAILFESFHRRSYSRNTKKKIPEV